MTYYQSTTVTNLAPTAFFVSRLAAGAAKNQEFNNTQQRQHLQSVSATESSLLRKMLARKVGKEVDDERISQDNKAAEKHSWQTVRR